MVLTAWYGIRNPGKNPTMHLFHWSALSSSMSSEITSRWPSGWREKGSRVNLVLESETRTLFAHEVWEASYDLPPCARDFDMDGKKKKGNWDIPKPPTRNPNPKPPTRNPKPKP
jgi:hypothetical protein